MNGKSIAILKNSYPSTYQNVTEEKFKFLMKKLSKSSENHYLSPHFNPSIKKIVEALETLIQKRNNHNEGFIAIKVSRKTQKNGNYLA